MFSIQNFRNALFLFAVLNTDSVMFGCCDRLAYSMPTRIATSISLAAYQEGEEARLPIISLSDRQRLCVSALENSSFPQTEEKKYIFEPLFYEIQYIDESEAQIAIALDCCSHPSLYIGFGSENATPEWMIHVEDSHQYSFLEESVFSITRSDLAMDETRVDVAGHHFHELDPRDRWNLCLAALRRSGGVAWLQSITAVEDPELFPHVMLVDHKHHEVVMECPTRPMMYLVLSKATSSSEYKGDRLVRVLFREFDKKE